MAQWRPSGSCSSPRAGSSSSSPTPSRSCAMPSPRPTTHAGRDPRDWTLQGSNDGTTWTTLDARSGEDFSERFQTRQFSFANDVAYRHYRLDITANHGDGLIQLAELQLSDGDTTRRRRDMRSIVGDGPRGGYNAKSGVGFTGLHALQYAGRHAREDRGYSYNKVFDVDVARQAPDRALLPDLSRLRARRPQLPEHVRRRRPRVHRRHLPQRPRGDGPARRDAEPAGPGRLEDALHEPVELQALAHRRASRPARRSTASSSPTTTPTGRPTSAAGSTTSRSGRRSPRRGARSPPTGSSRPAARTRAAASRAATTSPPPRCRTASTSGPRSPTRAR